MNFSLFTPSSTYKKQHSLCLIACACLFTLSSHSVYALEVITHPDKIDQLEVITHPDNIDQLEQLEQQQNLASVFAMRILYWPNGERIRVIVLPDNNPMHQRFVKENLHLFPHQLRRTWNRLTYTGTGQAPSTVNSATEMQELVNQTKNSIGYIHNGEPHE